MQTSTGESLLDEVDFLAELETLEDGLATRMRSLQHVEAPAASGGRDAVFHVPAAPWAPVDDVPAVEPEAAPSMLSRVMAAAMFVLMMGVGAAGAALVFHDRVSRLLALW